MGTNGNTVKRAVVLLLAVMRALLHGTFNAFVCLKLVIHIDGLLKFAYAGIKGNASKRPLLSIPALLYSAHWHHTLCIYRKKAEKNFRIGRREEDLKSAEQTGIYLPIPLDPQTEKAIDCKAAKHKGDRRERSPALLRIGCHSPTYGRMWENRAVFFRLGIGKIRYRFEGVREDLLYSLRGRYRVSGAGWSRYDGIFPERHNHFCQSVSLLGEFQWTGRQFYRNIHNDFFLNPAACLQSPR